MFVRLRPALQALAYAAQLGMNVLHRASIGLLSLVVCYSLFGLPDFGEAVLLAGLCGVGLVLSMRRSTSSSRF